MTASPRSDGPIDKFGAISPANRRDADGDPAARRYNSVVAKLILAFAFNLIYHRSFESRIDRMVSSPAAEHHRVDHNRTNSSAIGGFVPSWEYNPLAEQYMGGNLTCIFEVAHYNPPGQNKTTSDPEDPRNCGKWRYRPRPDWIAPDPLVVFDRLPHGAKIYFLIDSVGNQHARDFMCSLASVSKIVGVVRDDMPAHLDHRGKTAGYGLKGATFQSYYEGNKTKHVGVVIESGNFGRFNPKESRRRFGSIMGAGRKDDVFVINQGLHYKSMAQLLGDIDAVKGPLQWALNRGARVLWRETNAGHFNSTNGHWKPVMKTEQEKKAARCVDSSWIDPTASYDAFNAQVTPVMKSLGVHVLETWEATFLMPEWCHVGRGTDCVHLIQPGATSYLTESLLEYIEKEM